MAVPDTRDAVNTSHSHARSRYYNTPTTDGHTQAHTRTPNICTVGVLVQFEKDTWHHASHNGMAATRVLVQNAAQSRYTNR